MARHTRVRIRLAGAIVLAALTFATTGTLADLDRVSVLASPAAIDLLEAHEPWADDCWARLANGIDCPLVIMVWTTPETGPVCADSQVVRADCTASLTDLNAVANALGSWCDGLSDYDVRAYSASCKAVDAARAIRDGNVPDCTHPQGPTDPVLDAPACVVWRRGPAPAPAEPPRLVVPSSAPLGYGRAFV